MSGKTKDVEYRRQQIMKLGYMIQVCLLSSTIHIIIASRPFPNIDAYYWYRITPKTSMQLSKPIYIVPCSKRV